MQVFIILLLISVAYCDCCNNRFGIHINAIDWSKYVFKVNTQGNTPSCWAQSVASFIEIMYYKKTGLKFDFSSKQIFEHAYEQDLDDRRCVPMTDLSNGGNPICGLQYSSIRGVMTTFDYNHGGYDVRNTMPIGINNLQLVGGNYHMIDLNTYLEYLNNTPVIGSFYAQDNTYVTDDVKQDGILDHAVVVTNICEHDGTYYVEYVNSYGKNWGQCGGFGYIRITDDNHELVNNRFILSEFVTANVYDMRLPRSDVCHNQLDFIMTQSKMMNGLILFIIIVMTAILAILIYLLKKNTFSYMRNSIHII
jgi:hypothetical protein